MIKDNYFYVENLKSIVFIGYSKLLPELIKFNNNNKISSKIITSTDQSTDITVEFKIFNKIDEAFYKYLKKEFNIKSTLFISLGSRLIFDSKAVDFFSGNLINFHGTRLPYDSGGGGSSWKIMRNDRIDNQLVHIIDEGIDNIQIAQIDAQDLPFRENTFDFVTIAFGLRNVTDKEKALNSIFRVLRPGGKLIILEFSKPTNEIFREVYDLFSFEVIPKIGEFIAKTEESYRYLAESIRMHPTQEELKEMMGDEFSEAFLKLKHQEWNAFVSHFSTWERENTLDI